MKSEERVAESILKYVWINLVRHILFVYLLPAHLL